MKLYQLSKMGWKNPEGTDVLFVRAYTPNTDGFGWNWPASE